jgi:predicted nucleic acid-binding protein
LERELRKGETGPATSFLEKLPQRRICSTPTIAGEFCQGISIPDRGLWDEAFAPHEMLEITRETGWIDGAVCRDLAPRGELIETNDLWIAATAMTHVLPLATGNAREFGRVRGFTVVQV